MISRRGLSATSIREMAKHAEAPLGSTYHYFPEGKQQLATEAVRYAGDTVARLLSEELEAGPAAGLGAFLALWRKIVV
ncbi:TetR/AcrR family transcriptional regulator, partial [Streptomyces umbrinus]|uniref:TetR/AcrR family transcriptional regulator n=1 Tax=Streptomyces umbrinus TaxID=67370 RepID=UPI003C2DDBD6